MKKILLATLAVVAMASFATQANAQAKYQGEIDLAPGYWLTNDGFFMANLHTTHGVRLDPNWMVGLGTGLNSLFIEGEFCGFVPIYAHAKYYFKGEGPSFYAATDIGYAFGATNNFSGWSGFYFSPMIAYQTSGPAYVGVGYQLALADGFRGAGNALYAKIGLKW